MLKEKRQFFEFALVAADLFAVSVAWCIAYWLRFVSDVIPIPVEKGIPPFSTYFSLLIFIWFIWAFVFKRMGLYRPMRGVRRTRELWLLINANGFSVLLLIAVTYLFWEKSVEFSRLVFVYFGCIATVTTSIQRGVVRFILRELRRRGYNLRYLLIVGAGKVAGDLATRIRLHRELGIQLLGCLSKDGTERRGPKGIPIVGSYTDLAQIKSSVELDQVIIALPLEDQQLMPEIMAQLEDSLVDIKIVPDIYQFASVGASIEEFEGLPVISLQGSPLDGIHRFVKRALDLGLASFLFFALLPFMFLIAVLIKITSRGPIFYRQERVSVDGTKFYILKFRTMLTDAEASGPGWTTKDDSRVTTVGKFLRKFNLDELPQLWNVIKGDMSIVGPRPERPIFIQEFRQRIPKYILRHKVPAGITGWAQVHGWRGDTSIDKRIEYDLYYIENWSLFFDLKIMLLTLVKGFSDRNAC